MGYGRREIPIFALMVSAHTRSREYRTAPIARESSLEKNGCVALLTLSLEAVDACLKPKTQVSSPL
jgi:hypothetical protein